MRKILLFLMITMLITISVSAQITVWEATGSVSTKTFPTNDPRLTAPLQLPLGPQRNDFTGAPDEFYDIFYSNKEGTEVARGENRNSCITIRGQYNGGSAQGFNITKVADGANHYPYVTAFTLGSNGNATSVSNAVDGNQNTFTSMGKAFGDSYMSITVCKEPQSIDVCCPPLTKETIASQLVYQGTTIPNSYTLKFTPTPQFVNMMQSYANTLFNSQYQIKNLNMVWELVDTTSNQSLSSHWISWQGATSGGSGILGPTNFFNPSSPHMAVNKRYKIHIWMNMTTMDNREVWFGKGCDDYDVFVGFEVQKNARDSKPTLVFTDAQGKRIEPRYQPIIKK
jgi:hypothetical protein